ncbi:Tol-pal system protein YbgF [Candidatus Magnetomoraceae bacterium gMMP-15]
MKKLIVLCLVFICGCIGQEDILQMDNRLTALENQGMNFQNSGKEISASVMAVKVRVAEIGEAQLKVENQVRNQFAMLRSDSSNRRDELRQIKGRLEEIEHYFKQKFNGLKESQKKDRNQAGSNEIARLKKRIVQLEQYLGIKPSEISRKALISKTKSVKSKSSDQKLYAAARKLFDQGNFEKARKGFVDFIQKYPKSENADNAQFWIGEIYYREKWYEKAILEYQKVIEEYSKGNKVPAALLKQGLSFLYLDDKANARLILKELTRKFPKSNEADVARKKLGNL